MLNQLILKFPTKKVVEMKGNQIFTKECYVTRPKPFEPIKKVMLNEELGQAVKVKTDFAKKYQRSATSFFLQEYKDVFAWKVNNMLRIGWFVIEHQLNISLDVKRWYRGKEI